jgi:hypothetical protein
MTPYTTQLELSPPEPTPNTYLIDYLSGDFIGSCTGNDRWTVYGLAVQDEFAAQCEKWLAVLDRDFPPFDTVSFDDFEPTNVHWYGGEDTKSAHDPEDFKLTAGELLEDFGHHFPVALEFDGVKLDPYVGMAILRMTDPSLELANLNELRNLDKQWRE